MMKLIFLINYCLRRAFANHTSTDIKLSKTPLSKMMQSGGFLGRLLGPLLKTGLPLMKSVIQPLAQSVLIPIELTAAAAAAAADAGIHKKILGSGQNTTLIMSNDEMKDILNTVKSLEDSGLLLKGVHETIKNEAKEQKGGFLSMLLSTLGATLLGNMLAGKGEQQMELLVYAMDLKGLHLKNLQLKKILIPPHPLTNFEIQMHYQNESRFNGVYSRNNLPDKIKDGAYVINLDEYSDIGTHWIALYVNTKTVTYFDSFGVEHIPKEIKIFINNKNIIANVFRIQAYDSVMCGYFCIGFIDFMFKGNTLTDFTNPFSPNNFKENDNIILNYFLTNL